MPLVLAQPGHEGAQAQDTAVRCDLNLEHVRYYPHAYSGCQRRQICIVHALASKPDFVACNERVSALAVATQAEIVSLLKDLQDEMGVSLLFIAHDLSVVAQMSHRVAVMPVGRFVGYAPTDNLFVAPRHTCPNVLLSAVPRANPDVSFHPIRLDGEVSNPASAPSGSRSHTRCAHAELRGSAEASDWREIAPERRVACHFAEAFDISRPRADTAE